MITETIKQAASDKAFAKLTMLAIDIEQSKEDIRKGNTGPITMDELLSLHKGLLKQQQLWNYIAQLIEKDNGK